MSVMTMNNPEPRSGNDKPVEQASISEVPEYTANGQDRILDDPYGPDWNSRGVGVVAQFVDAFVELISDFGAPPNVCGSFRGHASKFLLADDELTYWKRAKNLACFFKALYLQNALPDVTGYNYCGQWKKWSKSRMVFSRRNTSLWASTFKIKNAAARLSDDACYVTMVKHAVSVGKEMTGHPVEIDSVIESIRPLLERARDSIANDLFKKDDDLPAASNSACYESSREKFGQVGYLMERVFGLDSPMVVPGINFCGFGPQVRVTGEATDCFNSCKPDSLLHEAYDYDTYLRRLEYVEREEAPSIKRTVFYESIVVDGVLYENSWFDTYYFPEAENLWMNEIFIDSLLATTRELALAKVACVLEPFKVRIITKGEASLQYMSSFFQKAIFNFNRTVPCFRLVGRAPSTLDLIDLKKSSEESDNPFQEGSLCWASSDFSGASDGTSGIYRDRIFEILISRLPEHYQSILRACNGDHIVEYPRVRGKTDVAPVHQSLGTLMGERTSFPVLCYEVLGAHVSNLRRCGDRRSLDRILQGVLINGDDRLTYTLEAFEDEFWEFSAKFLGFTESIGKSYRHPFYANINSQSYIFRDIPWKVPVRASGLEHGQKKLDEPFDPTCVITQILDGCIGPSMEWTVLQRFLDRFRHEITVISAGRNLFVHPSVGGLGNRLPAHHTRKRCRRASGELCGHASNQHWKVVIALDQQLVAAALCKSSQGKLGGFGPDLPLVEPLPTEVRTPWDVYGKPTYWNSDEFELKEMTHRYKRELAQLFRSGSLVQIDLPPQGLLLESRIRTFESDVVLEVMDCGLSCLQWVCPICLETLAEGRTCECGMTSLGWCCAVCEDWNPYIGAECSSCGLIEHPAQLIEKFRLWSSDRKLVRPVNRLLNYAKRGTIAIELDEFDFMLRCFALQCARFEYADFPTVRFRGRAVDLWGEDPTWCALRPAHLVWGGS